MTKSKVRDNLRLTELNVDYVAYEIVKSESYIGKEFRKKER